VIKKTTASNTDSMAAWERMRRFKSWLINYLETLDGDGAQNGRDIAKQIKTALREYGA
jgi:hypothetical protein